MSNQRKSSVTFSIIDWSVWMPLAQTKAVWLETVAQKIWREVGDYDEKAAPKLPHVQAMLRRRFSRLTKMCIYVADECAGERKLRTVFSSPHGEIHKTQSLLKEIAAEELVSPMAFSLSVHNTASGLNSIVTENRMASTALAAGTSTLESAVIDAVIRQQAEDNSPVLLVYGDEPLPDFYQKFGGTATIPYAIALLIDAQPSKADGNPYFELGFVPKNDNAIEPVTGELNRGLEVLSFMGDPSSNALLVPGERVVWHWRKVAGDSLGG